MKAFLLALQFLTVLSPNPGLRADAADLGRSRLWYAVVGLLLGLALAGAAWLLGWRLPPLPLAALLLLFWEGATRFLHLDGVMDSADALVHITTRERSLEIMKDSRVGAFGVAAAALLVVLKFACLASLSGPWLLGALVAAPCLGRGLAAGLSALMPPAKPGQGLGAQVGQPGSLAPLWVSVGVGAATAWLALGLAGLLALAGVLLVGALLGAWFWRRLGGVTGDCLGASIEAGECAALLVICALS